MAQGSLKRLEKTAQSNRLLSAFASLLLLSGSGLAASDDTEHDTERSCWRYGHERSEPCTASSCLTYELTYGATIHTCLSPIPSLAHPDRSTPQIFYLSPSTIHKLHCFFASSFINYLRGYIILISSKHSSSSTAIGLPTTLLLKRTTIQATSTTCSPRTESPPILPQQLA